MYFICIVTYCMCVVYVLYMYFIRIVYADYYVLYMYCIRIVYEEYYVLYMYLYCLVFFIY